ncbi:MAG: hypothetical protein KAI53_02180 [Candidatus Aenigmarchaeota archaeon]|nr:hypothetical protein [Candidatus Aenigmarchaeota archaeon]
MFLDVVYSKIFGKEIPQMNETHTDVFSFLGVVPLGSSNYGLSTSQHMDYSDKPRYSNPVVEFCGNLLIKYPHTGFIIYKNTEVNEGLKQKNLIATVNSGIS